MDGWMMMMMMMMIIMRYRNHNLSSHLLVMFKESVWYLLSKMK